MSKEDEKIIDYLCIVFKLIEELKVKLDRIESKIDGNKNRDCTGPK